MSKGKLKSRDIHGRTPERILKEFGYRYIIPYMLEVDLMLCRDVDRRKEIAKYHDDHMELLRHRDPVNWAAKMIQMKKTNMANKKEVKCT